MKTKIALFFGGMSGEYAVSLASAAAVLRALDPDLYEPLAVGITQTGEWLLTYATPDEIERDAWQTNAVSCLLSPDRGRKGLLLFEESGARRILPDLLFPLLHGKYGEDGCIQGLFALSGIPFVSSPVLASAVGMHKHIAKTLAQAAGIPVLRGACVAKADGMTAALAEISASLAFPVFVKPASGGSSVGAGIVRDPRDLPAALTCAWEADEHALVEPYCPAREIEVAVLDGIASRAGEIVLPTGSFYDYDTKYKNGRATLCAPAQLTSEEEARAREYALRLYRLFACRGQARVDFFLTNEGELYFNEINTLPGFTADSMFPRLMMGKGGLPALLARMIAGARAE
jgi:D-alanine--D-alanine ligase